MSHNPILKKGLKGKIVLIKYGGNAMVDDTAKRKVIDDIITLKKEGAIPVVVHGGGRVIKEVLEQAGIRSEFISGHRKTDAQTMRYVEMALSGNVNSELVQLLNKSDYKAVGLSGKDGGMVTAKKRRQTLTMDGQSREADLGFVGDVASINPELIHTIIDAGYIPVVSPVSMGADQNTYNINADMFAGHLAGALQACHYVVLTDVDGLLTDINDASTLVGTLTAQQAKKEVGHLIQGGMIPKIESCLIALENGVEAAHILNGTTPHAILNELLTDEGIGTLIKN